MSSAAGVTRVLMAVVCLVSWMFVSSYLILLNRHLMVDLGFKYSMTLSGFGMVCSGILSFLACRVFKIVECKATISMEFWSSKMLPVGFFMALTLWTGNAVYLHLSVAFIQMFKAPTPVITMACLYVAGLEDPTSRMIAAVLITAAGTAVSAYGEVNLSFIGLVLNVASGVSESIRLVMTQWLLQGLKFHPIEGLMYLAPACSLWLYAGATVMEARQIAAATAEGKGLMLLVQYPLQFAAAGVMGFLVNILAYTSIKLASSLTLKVLGTVKNTLLAVWTVVFMGEVVTAVQALGYTITLIGFAWYNQIKMQQIAKEADHKDDGRKMGDSGKLRSHESGKLKGMKDVDAHITQPLLGTGRADGATVVSPMHGGDDRRV